MMMRPIGERPFSRIPALPPPLGVSPAVATPRATTSDGWHGFIRLYPRHAVYVFN